MTAETQLDLLEAYLSKQLLYTEGRNESEEPDTKQGEEGMLRLNQMKLSDMRLNAAGVSQKYLKRRSGSSLIKQSHRKSA